MEEGRNFTGHIDKRVYEKWNRDLPVHHKFQVKLLFSRHADLKGEFFKATKEWLGKDPKLLGTYITINIRSLKNRNIEDCCTN